SLGARLAKPSPRPPASDGGSPTAGAFHFLLHIHALSFHRVVAVAAPANGPMGHLPEPGKDAGGLRNVTNPWHLRHLRQRRRRLRRFRAIRGIRGFVWRGL